MSRNELQFLSIIAQPKLEDMDDIRITKARDKENNLIDPPGWVIHLSWAWKDKDGNPGEVMSGTNGNTMLALRQNKKPTDEEIMTEFHVSMEKAGWKRSPARRAKKPPKKSKKTRKK